MQSKFFFKKVDSYKKRQLKSTYDSSEELY